ARTAGLAASVAFPISVGPRVLGVLEFSCGAPEVPDHSLLEVLASFGEHLAVVLERLRAREEREQREVQLHQAQQLANLGSWEWSPATGVARFSRELNRILGLPVGRAATDANGSHEAGVFGTLDQLMERVHPDDRGAVGSAIRAAAREGTVRELEYRVLRADGERVVQSRIGSMGGGSGGPVVIGTAQDVTDRRRAERDFAHQVTRLRLILEGITEGVVVADTAGRVVEANPAAVALLGLPRRPGPDGPISLGEETPAFLPDMLTPYPADGLPLLAAVRGQALDGALMYVRPRTRNGKGIWLRVTGRPLVDPDGTPAGGVIIFTEVTGPPEVGDPAPVADPPLPAPQQLPLPQGQDADAG
ncbi:MAG TPA: PAS domain-containing protein, partial [Actinomycetota bacterium]|nr:PAS domain-containing protein [Actinomycetota bacterium]